MNIKPILIVPGETKSIFFEIFFKALKFKNYKSPIIIICNFNQLKTQFKRFNFKRRYEILDLKVIENKKLNTKTIYIIDMKVDHSKIYIQNCFEIAFKLIKRGFSNKLLNGPINKKRTLNKKYLGVTEYIADKFNKKKIGMLIYNKNLSVSPLTTHLPLKLVSKKITKRLIEEKVIIIDSFYRKNFGFKPSIGVTGLNPHCESILKYNEDDIILKPAILNLKKKRFNINGPFAADTIFLKQNRIKFDVILGMYHDQVLTPAKTLFEYDATNITMGLPFLRVSPDHGPNEKMFKKNQSNPKSLINSLIFLDRK